MERKSDASSTEEEAVEKKREQVVAADQKAEADAHAIPERTRS